MKSLASWFRAAVLIALAFFPMASLQPAQLDQALAAQSDIVFTGTVRQIAAASFAQVPSSNRTIVVRADSVLKKPSAVSLKKGDDVTVEVKDASAFKVGNSATFYTRAWILGAGVALKELSHVAKPPAGEVAAVSPQPVQEVSEKASAQEQLASDQQLQQRLSTADAVVVGTVVEVHAWTAKTLAPSRRHVTEHDPNWQEAVIQVQSALKGAKSGQKLVVRFPGSMDVAWANSPRFKRDQQGTFVLHKDQVSGSPKALLANAQVTAYTALRRTDVLSADAAARVRSLMSK